VYFHPCRSAKKFSPPKLYSRQELEVLVQQHAASSCKGRLVTADITAGLEQVRRNTGLSFFCMTCGVLGQKRGDTNRENVDLLMRTTRM
jgi:hypothetical protein